MFVLRGHEPEEVWGTVLNSRTLIRSESMHRLRLAETTVDFEVKHRFIFQHADGVMNVTKRLLISALSGAFCLHSQQIKSFAAHTAPSAASLKHPVSAPHSQRLLLLTEDIRGPLKRKKKER